MNADPFGVSGNTGTIGSVAINDSTIASGASLEGINFKTSGAGITFSSAFAGAGTTLDITFQVTGSGSDSVKYWWNWWHWTSWIYGCWCHKCLSHNLW